MTLDYWYSLQNKFCVLQSTTLIFLIKTNYGNNMLGGKINNFTFKTFHIWFSTTLMIICISIQRHKFNTLVKLAFFILAEVPATE